MSDSDEFALMDDSALGNGNNCLEVATTGGRTTVRDTANRDGGTSAFSARAWEEFTSSLR